jgi:hypothetical protein
VRIGPNQAIALARFDHRHADAIRGQFVDIRQWDYKG